MQRLDTEATSAPRLHRDATTLLLYAAQGVVGFLLNGLGAILGPLRRDLDVDRAQVAFYPSLFAAALVAVGLIGGRVVERAGHRAALMVSLGAMAAGAGLLASQLRLATVCGAILLGMGSAVSVQVLPAALARRHPTLTAAAIGEANAVSSSAAVLAPAAVAVAIAVGVGWQAGWLLAVLPAAALLLILTFRNPFGSPSIRSGAGSAPAVVARTPSGLPGYEPSPLLGRWADVVLAVSVEFCLVFWAADAFREWHGAGPAAAPALASLFLLAMALVRLAARRLTAGRHPSTVTLAACLTAAAGFVAFWSLPGLAGSAAGLFVAGAGVALLYPVTISRLVAAWPDAQDRAAARGALASGLAIGVAPFVLARLADASGLRAAYLIVPVLVALLAAHAAATLSRSRRGDAGRPPGSPSAPRRANARRGTPLERGGPPR